MLWTVKALKINGILGGSMSDSLYMIAHGQIKSKPLISEIVPFEECRRATDSVYSGENIAVLLRPRITRGFFATLTMTAERLISGSPSLLRAITRTCLALA